VNLRAGTSPLTVIGVKRIAPVSGVAKSGPPGILPRGGVLSLRTFSGWRVTRAEVPRSRLRGLFAGEKGNFATEIPWADPAWLDAGSRVKYKQAYGI